MKKLYFVLFVLSSLVFSAAAQTAKPTPIDPTEKNLRKHVEYLASDKLEGRRTGERSATAAAGYVANNFAQFKLRPGVTSMNGGKTRNGFLQKFPYVAGVTVAKETTIKLSLTKNGDRITFENMLSIKPVAFSANGEAKEVPVVFARFGITSKEPVYDDYSTLDVKGKVVMIFDGVPEAERSLARYDVRARANIAKEHGAIGVLLIARESKIEADPLMKMQYEGAMGDAALPVLLISRNTAAGILAMNEEELKIFEDALKMKKEAGVSITAKIADTAPRISYKVNIQKNYVDAYNVIGILPGTDPTLKNEAIVIGAHYDHLGRGGAGSLAPNSTEIHHGADDNASGVSAVIELARQFVKEKANKRTIIFMSFGGEEEGLLGSKYWVNNPTYPIDKVVAMLNLDMVGRLNEGKLNVGGIGTASEMKALVEKENAANGAPAFNLQLSEDGFGPSDHASFYGKKIPVLFFFTGTHLDYHKPSDTSEKINYLGLNAIRGYVTRITKTIDANAAKPTYTVAKAAAQGDGRRSFNVSLGTIPGYGDTNNTGLLLDGVRDGSSAAKAGIQGGDKITKLAGIEIKNISDYMRALGEMKAGETYDVTVVRGSETLTLKIVPAPSARRQ